MRWSLACLLVLFRVQRIIIAHPAGPQYTVEEAPSSDIEEHLDSDGLVQENPGYVGPGGDDSSSDDDSDVVHDDQDYSSDYVDEDEEERDGKSAVNRELSKSFQRGRAVGRLVMKHKARVTVALLLIAFRREIWMIITAVLTDATPGGGRRMKRLSMTSILKILLVVDLLRKFVGGGDGTASPLTIAALLGNPSAFVGHLLKDLRSPSNPAYIPPIDQHYTFERVNEYYSKDSLAFIKALDPPRLDAGTDNRTMATKVMEASFMRRMDSRGREYNSTAVILDMSNLDTMVSRLSAMRDQVSFILSHHRTMMNMAKKLGDTTNTTNFTQSVADRLQADPNPSIEVIVLLGSPGGSASHYGLAAQQIGRLRDEPGIKVTVIVDTVAASGGYMMACMATPGRLYAAPFAVVGSIGVIGQQINIHNTLESWGVTPLVFRGGKDKAPLGMIGEVTEEGMRKVQMTVDKTHDAFKQHVVNARPNLADSIDSVASGDVWLGVDALKAGLVDRLITSDEYIGERISEGARVLKLIKYDKRIHLPAFLSSGPPRYLKASVEEMRKFTLDARRVVSKAASFVGELPDKSPDISTVAAVRALGVNTVNAKTN